MRAHAWISGRVQGVFFRASTRQKASQLGLSGWVKNLADGRVELEAEGPRDDLEKLIAWAHEGPERARVEDVQVRYHQDERGHSGFAIRR